MVTVDAVLFARRQSRWQVLLIRRGHDPFAGHWAFPGGFVNEDEPLDHAVARELQEETGLSGVKLAQLGAFGDPGRDPRGHTISVVYWGRVNARLVKPQAADDAAEVGWHPVDDPPSLAFDHAKILKVALGKVRRASAPGKAEPRS